MTTWPSRNWVTQSHADGTVTSGRSHIEQVEILDQVDDAPLVYDMESHKLVSDSPGVAGLMRGQ
jgi:hypothetical protein